MQLPAWFRLLSDHNFKFDRWPMFLGSATVSTATMMFDALQAKLFRATSEAIPLRDDPIFVIGHWRCGTTLVHQLLLASDRLVSPTVFQCFAPRSFLVCENWLKPLLRNMLPDRRPMDNVRLGWDEPMEDEFAMLLMGGPSVYRRIAFPNDPAQHLAAINLHGLSADALADWKSMLLEFLRYINLKCQRRLVLKSPPHTARIGTLLEMFPKARFVHVVRDPFQFIPSTIHMWAALDEGHAFQNPRHEHLVDFVFDAYRHLFDGYERDHALLNDENLITIRFEDLLANQRGVMRQVFERLSLDGANDLVSTREPAETANTCKYQANNHPLPSSLAVEISRRCTAYLERFSFDAKPSRAA